MVDPSLPPVIEEDGGRWVLVRVNPSWRSFHVAGGITLAAWSAAALITLWASTRVIDLPSWDATKPQYGVEAAVMVAGAALISFGVAIAFTRRARAAAALYAFDVLVMILFLLFAAWLYSLE